MTRTDHFHLLIQYDWKPSVSGERRAYHAGKIRGLATRVPGLLDVRFGPRHLGHPQETSSWDDAAVMVFQHQDDYARFGTSPVHDEVAAELMADLERITYVGFTG